MGTELFRRGFDWSTCFERLSETHPEVVSSIHADYREAGAHILSTNTFGANRYRLEKHGCAEAVERLIGRSVALARAAAAGQCWVAGSVGPLGVSADFDPSAARDAFAASVSALATAGVDLLFLETFSAIAELREALEAVRREAPGIPVVAHMIFQTSEGPLAKDEVARIAEELRLLGADAIGVNCSSNLDAVIEVVERLQEASSLAIAAQPNAGLPRAGANGLEWPLSDSAFGDAGLRLLEAGASLIGGCCGTSPRHIKELSARLARVG